MAQQQGHGCWQISERIESAEGWLAGGGVSVGGGNVVLSSSEEGMGEAVDGVGG